LGYFTNCVVVAQLTKNKLKSKIRKFFFILISFNVVTSYIIEIL